MSAWVDFGIFGFQPDRSASEYIRVVLIATVNNDNESAKHRERLSLEQTPKLLQVSTRASLRERRDNAILALLLGCGLGRSSLESS